MYSEVTAANSWIANKKGLSTNEWISSLKMTANLAAVRSAPGRSLDGTRCRHGCPEIETLALVLGFCEQGLLLRNSKHHLVRFKIAAALRNKGWIVEEEISCLAENGSTRRVDILAYNADTKQGIIVDPTIRFEIQGHHFIFTNIFNINLAILGNTVTPLPLQEFGVATAICKQIILLAIGGEKSSGSELVQHDVSVAHRIPSRPGKTRPIVIRFTKSRSRDEWLQLFRNEAKNDGSGPGNATKKVNRDLSSGRITADNSYDDYSLNTQRLIQASPNAAPCQFKSSQWTGNMLFSKRKLLAGTAILLLVCASSTSSCPVSCRCNGGVFDVASYRIVNGPDCSGAFLQDIPSGMTNKDIGLNASYNNINILRNNALNDAGATGLEMLILNNNGLAVIEKDAFRGLLKLRSISLSNNKLTSIDPNVFSYSALLSTLYLKNNMIETLHPDTFKVNFALSNLYLTKNRITSLNNSIFKNNPRLWILEFSFNSLSTLPDDLVNSTLILRHFDFSKNCIPVLYPEIFWNKTELVHVDLSSNNLSVIHVDTFKDNMNIVHIDLSNNYITGIDRKTFRNNPYLQYLNLNGNKIVAFHFEVLKVATKLRYLDLGSNDIGYLHSNTFTSNLELRFLDVSHNRIISLTHTIFQNNPNLEYVVIKGNYIASIDSELFKYNSFLRHIDASFNRLTYILRNTFLTNLELREFNVSNNVITSFHPETLKFATKLQSFDISRNAIKFIQPQSFASNTHLKFLDLSRNRISDIDPHMFIKNPNIIDFRIKYNKLKFVNDEPILHAPSLRYFSLDFCNISYLPVQAFQNLSGLVRLSLSNNRLMKLDESKFGLSPNVITSSWSIFSSLTQLKELDLTNNQFTTLDVRLFANLERLSRLRITGNPVQCNCKLKILRSWCLRWEVDTGLVLCDDIAKSSWDVVDTLACFTTSTTPTTTTTTVKTKPIPAWKMKSKQSPPTSRNVTIVIFTILAIVIVVLVGTFLWRRYRTEGFAFFRRKISQDNTCLIHDCENDI
ncbi:hypothetical protein ANN_18345 [Periplaneta americana]|uniref:Uncharacterized protein n=1 Tax=Periplaneta americana TaxID=6978 RepID=A0ABQ8SNZ9_PERAM|nr:hypothetical protein ANN_18345 [Periplaneta americana]